MNLITFEPTDINAEGQVALSEPALSHCREVLKVKIGDDIKVGQINGPLGSGKILELSGDKLRFHFSPNSSAPKPLPLTLVLALPRPKTLPRILQTISSLGVKEIHFINTWKVEKCFWSSDYLSEESVYKACRLGLEQAVDTLMPRVYFHKLFRPFVEDSLPKLLQREGQEVRGFVAHPYGAKSLKQVLPATDSWSVLVLGPEGGFIDYEVNKFKEAGFQAVNHGQRILKLETAVPTLVSQFVH